MFRTKQRIQQTGEVFTPLELVNEILDKLPLEVWQDPTKTFLDPAAGDGNFLVQVLIRKLNYTKCESVWGRCKIAFQALETVYGVELMEDNVDQCQIRLLQQVEKYLTPKLYAFFQNDLVDIVNHNIVCHDALTWDFWAVDPH